MTMSLLFIDLDFISWLQTVGGPTQIPMSQPSFEFLGYKAKFRESGKPKIDFTHGDQVPDTQ